MSGATIADRIARTPQPSGFDYLRIVLALLVIADHAVLTCLGLQGQSALFAGPVRPIIVSLVPVWFAMSGYLVAGSLDRNGLPAFLCLRVLRIFPALAVMTLFCALLLGPLLTTLPLSAYFTATTFFKYLMNLFGLIHYQLPGVFEANPYPFVNVQLWTLPFQIKSYLALAALALIGAFCRRDAMLIVAAASLLGSAAYALHSPPDAIDTWHLLAPSFLTGVCLYLHRGRVPWNSALALVALIATLAIQSLTHPLAAFAAVPLAYLAVWAGHLNPRRNAPFFLSGNYSYALYLYSFPVQQALIVKFSWASVWWLNLMAAIPLSLVLAVLSWQLVERPIQMHRHEISQTWIALVRSRFRIV